MIPRLAAEFAAHLGEVRFGVALVRDLMDTQAIRRVEQAFGVALTEKTAAKVLLLNDITTHYKPRFIQDAKAYKFDVEKAIKRLTAADAKAAAPKTKASKSKGGK